MMPVVHIKVARAAHAELCRVARAKECCLEDLLLESALVECAETREALVRLNRRYTRAGGRTHPMVRDRKGATPMVVHKLHLDIGG